MIRRKVTEEQVKIRERIMAELGAIPALSPAARKLLTAEGFLSYFLELRQLFPTYEQAYEELKQKTDDYFNRFREKDKKKRIKHN